MKIATVELESISPYSQSRNHDTPKKEKESHEDYRERTWRNCCHFNAQGNVVIPAMSFKNCLSEAAKYLGMQIPGKGKATFTKNIEAGVLVTEDADTGIKVADVEGEKLYLPSDGRRGSGKRVWKTYPRLMTWKTTLQFHILDDTVTQEVFRYHLEQAGKFIGIGRWRPRNNGTYGRFQIVAMTWEDA